MSPQMEKTRSGDRIARAEERAAMVDQQLRRRGISDARVLDAMGRIPRERFIPEHLAGSAYRDSPLSIGHGQTISQPYMVALMSETLRLTGAERVLEIGTGSGYQSAVLGMLAAEVISVERISDLSIQAVQILKELQIPNVRCIVGDGTLGFVPGAPYDRILVAAAAPSLPQALLDQLDDPGVMVVPCGTRAEQVLYRVRKQNGMTERIDLISCVFVPLLGKQGWDETEG